MRTVLPQPLLDPGAAGIDQPDDRGADLDRQIHHMADLAGMRLSERAPHDREILRIEVDLPAADLSRADDHPVAVKLLLVHPELGRLVGDEHLDLHEAPRIHQRIDPLPGAQLAAFVLLVDLFLTAPEARKRFLCLQLFILLFQGSSSLCYRISR